MSKTYYTIFKKIVLILGLTISASQLFAQTSNGIFFQAVARDNFSNAAKDRKIFVQSSIIQTSITGTKVLIEEHQATTDATGVFNISIGNGVRVGGTAANLSSVDWSSGPFFLNLKVAITPVAGSDSWDFRKEWIDMGTTNFGAVPFSFYAASVAGFDTKLSITDSAKMLFPYAKTIAVQALSTSVEAKLNSKLNIADSAIYITPTQLAKYNFSSGGSNSNGNNNITVDTTSLSNRINLKASTTDLTNISINIASNSASITSNTADIAILNASVITNAANINTNTTNISANTSTITILNTSVDANTASITNNVAAINLKAPIASPTFTGTTTAPIYASTPQILTSGANISWNPTLGLNASVTLDQNSTLIFSSTPAAGSYGTIVITQDAAGSRAITLPSTANQVLGSTSTTTITLSTAANAKDILNFYYDGTNCYWNIGQGYGQASTSSNTNLASSVTGTLAIANGGTGATALTTNNVLLGNGTNSLQTVAPGANGNILTSNGTTWTSVTPSNTAASAGTLSGTTLASNVINSTLTSVGVLTNATVSGKIIAGTSTETSPSAILEANSTTKGFLPPRMTGAHRDAISSPLAGLIIWCSNCGLGEIEVYNGSSWVNISGTGASAATNAVIGTQTWNIKNLDVVTYRDGTPIPQVTNPNGSNWGSLTTGAWCYYNNDPANGAIYGKIYNWYAIAGIYDAASLADPSLRKQFAPTGYHVPTKSEYTTLFTFLSNDGGKMKESGTTHWATPNTDATNSSGFTALPTGELQYDGSSFYWLGNYGYLWSSTLGAPQGNPTAWCVRLDYNNATISLGEYYTSTGLYVRCIKD